MKFHRARGGEIEADLNKRIGSKFRLQIDANLMVQREVINSTLKLITWPLRSFHLALLCSATSSAAASSANKR